MLVSHIAQAFGVSLIAFPLVWLLVGRRKLVPKQGRAAILVAGILVTAFLCAVLLFTSQLLFGDFIFASPILEINAVVLVAAPLSFACVVARLMRPLKLVPQTYQTAPHEGERQSDGDQVGQNLPIQR